MRNVQCKQLTRAIAYFPGFEPMDNEAHRQRYLRSCEMSSKAFNFQFEVGLLTTHEFEDSFAIKAWGPNWITQSKLFIFDHGALAAKTKHQWLPKLLVLSFWAGLKVLTGGALTRYFKRSWRFGVFFVYPFALLIVGASALALIALIPFFFNLPNYSWIITITAAILMFANWFLPFAEMLQTRQSLALWTLAVGLGQMNNKEANALIEKHANSLSLFFEQDADQFLITTFSLGAPFMICALAVALEKNPQLLKGRSVVIVTLGGQGLQCSLLKHADELREKTRVVLENQHIRWIDIQCLTDIVNLHGGKVAHDNGIYDLREPDIQTICVAEMLTGQTYRRIKWDALRVHRQFVYGSEQRSRFDFALMTSGPFDPRDFATFNNDCLPPLDSEGAVRNV
jgi:hypothetical protein